jgi:antibiotic biosynthesis monooxygenase (ABM) superfamily enzyme
MQAMNPPESITVSVTRTAKAGCEVDLERALHGFVQRSLSLPGQMGVHIMRPAPDSSSREYSIIRKFANREALTAFRDSPEYREWHRMVQEFTEGAERTEELTGLESWFTLPGATLRPLPKWKMAVATFAGVFPVASILTLALGPAIKSWPFLVRNGAFNACVVVLLTWVVMPLITKALHRWMHSTR